MAFAELITGCMKCKRSYPNKYERCPYCGYKPQYPKHYMNRAITDQERRVKFDAQFHEESFKTKDDEQFLISTEGRSLVIQAPFYYGELILPKSTEYKIKIMTIYKGKRLFTKEEVIVVPDKDVLEDEDQDDDTLPNEPSLYVDLAYIQVNSNNGLYSGVCESLKVYSVSWF